jgi:hypothetical protein
MPKRPDPKIIDQRLALEARALVLNSFRDGPLEDVHAGKNCPTCAGKEEYSHITQGEMKRIMKSAVNKVYALLWLRENRPKSYVAMLEWGLMNTSKWDEPDSSELEAILNLKIIANPEHYK